MIDIAKGLKATKEELLSLLIYQSKEEKRVFFLLLSFSIVLTNIFLWNTQLLDHQTICCDIMLGYDNPYILKRGFSNVTSHPFLAIFLGPIVLISRLFLVLGIKYQSLFVLLFCNYFIVQAQVVLRRYMYDVIGIDKAAVDSFTLFMAVTSCVLTLTMTVESFSLSFFVLTLLTYSFSYKLLKKESLPIGLGMFFTFTAGGITLTNVVKAWTPYFFEATSFKNRIKKSSLFVGFFLVLYAAFLIVMNFGFGRERFFDAFNRFERYSEPYNYDFLEYIQTAVTHFFGSGFLLPKFVVQMRPSPEGPSSVLINYDSTWEYILIFCIWLLILAGFFIERRNKIVQFLLLNLLVDIVLHVVLKYGIGEAFIYAGHWIFVAPIAMAWAYKGLTPRIKYYFRIAIIVISGILLINNGFRLSELYLFGLKYYE